MLNATDAATGEELCKEKAAVVILIGIFTYIVATAFIDVYHMAADTILICFCEDNANNHGEKLASANLQRFMTRNGKKKKLGDKDPEDDGGAKAGKGNKVAPMELESVTQV